MNVFALSKKGNEVEFNFCFLVRDPKNSTTTITVFLELLSTDSRVCKVVFEGPVGSHEQTLLPSEQPSYKVFPLTPNDIVIAGWKDNGKTIVFHKFGIRSEDVEAYRDCGARFDYCDELQNLQPGATTTINAPRLHDEESISTTTSNEATDQGRETSTSATSTGVTDHGCTWKCEQCGHQNSFKDANCQMCIKPPAKGSNSDPPGASLAVAEESKQGDAPAPSSTATSDTAGNGAAGANQGTVSSTGFSWNPSFTPGNAKWKCSTCLTLTDGSVDNCAACAAPRPNPPAGDKAGGGSIAAAGTATEDSVDPSVPGLAPTETDDSKEAPAPSEEGRSADEEEAPAEEENGNDEQENGDEPPHPNANDEALPPDDAQPPTTLRRYPVRSRKSTDFFY